MCIRELYISSKRTMPSDPPVKLELEKLTQLGEGQCLIEQHGSVCKRIASYPGYPICSYLKIRVFKDRLSFYNTHTAQQFQYPVLLHPSHDNWI